MNQLPLPGTDLAVSALCLGGLPFGNTITERESFALLDRFVELGGNFIDTARIYSDWVPGELRRSERILGDWLTARRCRDRVVIATKGAHPFVETPDRPRTSAAEIRDDLEGSLRKLRTGVIDLYWLHRDDPARPVRHFVGLLNTFLREKKIRAWGVSNWAAARFRDAVDYARDSGQQGPVANQPLWCLGWAQARPPVIRGLVKFDRPAYDFHRAAGLAVIPYTSQANGFFSKLALPADQRPANLAGSDFHTPPNLAASQVVERLARERNVAPSAVVLAYLWTRPFPVVPIIGCRKVAQLEDSAAALPVRLLPAELEALESASGSGLPAR